MSLNQLHGFIYFLAIHGFIYFLAIHGFIYFWAIHGFIYFWANFLCRFQLQKILKLDPDLL